MSRVQILGLRDYVDKQTGKTRKAEKFFDKGWGASSVKELFANLEEILEDIPEEERYNLYYTAANCLDQKGRILDTQSILPIDIDDIDTDKIDEYVPVVLNTLGLKLEDVAIVATGNGIQALIGIDDPIEDEEYFDANRVYYKALAGNIAHDLFMAGLIGTVDSSVFSAGRLLRLPLTKNIKPKKGEKKATFINRNLNYVSFDLVEKSGIPTIEHSDQVSKAMLDRLPPPDREGILSGCDFIKYCAENQEDVSEPMWYGMLSIVGRLEGGRELAHTFSKLHPDYDEASTDRKYHQAIEASGPRTCENISTLWDGCIKCENFQKCKSPISLKSANYITTRDTGFHNVVLDNKTGELKKGKPNYQDLMLYFALKHSFKSSLEGSMIYTYNSKYWDSMPITKVNVFAENNFQPQPDTRMCTEFKNKLLRNNVTELDFFEVEDKVNFANGVLDLNTMEFGEHDEKLGFRYVLPFEYNPLADCPRFDQFMEEITRKDPTMTQVLLEYMGYAISGMDPAIGSKALILSGEGSNGKSVFMDVLKHLVGKDNYCTLSMGRELDKAENRYQLDGKLFNVSEETPTNAMMDSSTFKALVAGGEVQARKLYCDSYSMRSKAKIIMACNALPDTKDLSHGMFRRLLIVPFKARFDSNIDGFDPLIRDKLFAEASGIFNKVLRALETFRKTNQFSDSETITKAVEDYRYDNNHALRWWDENVIEDSSAVIPASLLYLTYKMDMENEGIKVSNNIHFMRSLGLTSANKARKKIDGKAQRCVIGYKLIGDENGI